jgi:hypothetical protein
MYGRYFEGITAAERKAFWGKQPRQENYKIVNDNSTGAAACRVDL